MTLDTYASAALLGLVEGLTEFLPVSSTGHMILLADLLGFEGPPGHVFEIAIQLGAILAVCVVYAQRLAHVAVSAPTDPGSRRFILAIILGFLPAMAIGAVAHDFIKSALFSPWVVSVALIVGGIAILIIERMVHRPRFDRVEQFPPALSLGIGLAQCIAMIPGVSRSGATIMGALLLGVDRRAAAEFSFFLAIPTMAAATVYDLYKNRGTLTMDGAGVILLGFVVAFLAALMVVRGFVAYVGRHGFAPFAYYRIALGLVMIGILMAR